MGLAVIPIVLMSDFSDMPKFEDMTDENMKELFEQMERNVMKMVETSPLLKPRLLAMFDEMIEHGVFE